jgi:carbonic anhydrase
VETPDDLQPTVVFNNGHSWEVKVPTHHQLMIYGGPLMSRNYRLDHYTAHWGGSEHVVDSQQMDGELQLFHYHIQYKDWAEAIMHESAVAVVSVTLKISPIEHNQEVEKIGEILPQIKLKGQAAQTAEQVDLENILPKDKDYFTYLGSLTTPGFQENVVWMVLADPILVSQQVVDRIKELRYAGEESYKMTVNVRKMMPLGDRKVFRPSAE